MNTSSQRFVLFSSKAVKAFCICICFSLSCLLSFAQSTSWKGTTSTSWSNAANWTSGIPTATINAIIGDANFTGNNQPTITATAVCNSLTVGGVKASILTISANLTTTLDVTITANGRINQGGKTLKVSGSWYNSGIYSTTSKNAIVSMAGAASTINGSANTPFRKLTIAAGATTTLNVNVVFINSSSKLTVNGTLNSNESPSTYSMTGMTTATALAAAGVMKVNAATFAGNFGSTAVTIAAGGTIDYSSSTVAQTVSSSLTYSTLKISGTTVKTLGGNITLNSSAATAGVINVTSGTLDLDAYTANRGTSVAGGTLSVSNGATLKIKIQNGFPLNYATNTLSLTSTIEYYGDAQNITAKTYGNLTFSGLTGDVVKTMPAATAITVANNFTTNKNTANTVSFTAAGNITVTGITTLGTATTFNAAGYTHSLTGNWINNGTFNGNTGIVNRNGSGSVMSGPGTYTFNDLNITASNNTAAAATNITVNGNFATSAAGTFTHLATGTFTMPTTGKSISGTGIIFNNLVLSGVINTATSFSVTGDLTMNGGINATAGTVTLSGASKAITGTGSSITFNSLSVTGSITSTASYSINSSLDVSGSLTATAGTTTFKAASNLNGTANLYNVTINGTSFQLSTNAVLGIANVFTKTAGTFDVSTSAPNTVNYNGTVAQSVLSGTYHHLTFSNGNTKTAAGALTVNGDVSLLSATTFVAGTFTHSILGNWNNSGTFTAGTSTISFTGASNSAITGATTFNILTVGKSSASNSVTLASNVSVPVINMTKGGMSTGSNTLTITTNRTGNGIILGNIQRTHTFLINTAYEFEGPNNTITFTAVSGVTTVTVKATKGAVSDFPFGGSAGRLYDITIPSGTYTAKLRLHYEDDELNGNSESAIQLWKYSSSWSNAGKSANDATNNYVEQTGLAAINNRWTLSDDANVVKWTGVTSTDWNDATNWTTVQGSPSKPPSANDIVEIGVATFNNQPAINTSAVAKSILLGSAKAVTLSLNTGGSLNVNGNISGSWAGGQSHTLQVNNQSLTVNGSLVLSDGVSGHAINLSIGSGTVSITGSLTQSGGANVDITGAASMSIGGDFVYTNGTFTAGTGTVTYSGTASQIIGGVGYNNLTINKASGIGSINAATTVAGHLAITTGQLDLNAALTVTGNVTLSASTTLNNNAVTLSIGGNWNNGGNYAASNGSVIFNGSGSQSITASTFNNVTINKAGGAATLTGNIVINGNLSISAGTFDLATYNANRSSAGGSFTALSGSILKLAGANNFPINFSAYVLNANSTVEYNGSVAQNVSGINYGNLVLSNGSGNVKTLAASTLINGNITINSGASFNAGTYTIDLYGNWINNGTFTPATSTLLLEGSNKTISGNTTFNKVGVYGSYAVAGSNITYNGTLRIVTGGSFDGGSGAATLNGDLTNNGSLTSNGITNFSGNVVQTIRFENAVISNSSGVINFNGTVSPILNSTSAPTYATLNINNTGGINASVDWIVGVAFNVNSGATFNGGNSNHTIYGTFTNNGTVTSNGTMRYIASSAKTYAFGTNFTSTGTVSFEGSAAASVSGTPTLTNVTVSNSAGVTPVNGWNMSGNFTVTGQGIFSAGSNSFTVGGDIESIGTLNSGTSVFTMTSAAGELTGSQNTTFYDLTLTGNITANSDYNVAHNFTNNGTYDGSAGVVVMTGGTASIVTGSAATFNLAQLEIQKTSNAVTTLSKNLALMNSLTVTSGILDMGSYVATQDTTTGSVNSLGVSNGATLKVGGVNSLPVFSDYAIDSLSTVDYNGAAQAISAASKYGNLTLSTSGVKTANGALNIRNNFTLTNGSFTSGNYVDTLGGNWSMTSGTYTGTGTTFTLDGTADQYINTTANFNNVNVNKASGAIVLSSNCTITGVLNFLKGNIQTGSNLVILPSGASTTGAAQNTGWVNGRLQKYTATGSTLTQSFDIGGPSYYSPVSLIYTTVSTAGSLIAGATASAHPNIGTSTILTNKSIARYWTLAYPASGAVVFNNTKINFNWNAADNYASINATSERVAQYTGSTWSYPAITGGSVTTTSIQANTVTALGDFTVGEVCNVTSGFSYAAPPYCSNGTTATVTLSGGATAGTFTATPAGLTINAGTGTITLSSSAAGTYTVTNTVSGTGCTSVSTATITIHAAPSATIAYSGTPYCKNGTTATVTQTGTTGGTYTSTAGLSINATTGVVDLTASTAGTYTVTYAIAAANGCGQYQTTTSITITAAPSATIAYSGTPFCKSGTTAAVTQTGTVGGTYTSTAGLSINVTTGAIDITASTAGTHTVTYTVSAANGCSQYQTTTPITITAAPSATISYNSSPYCISAGTATVTQTGTTGGTYTATGSLPINVTTGVVDLATSVAGTYTITYSIAASGGCSVFTTTASITINTSGRWTGAVSTDWSVAGNWLCGILPVTTTNVVIPSGLTNYPIISAPTDVNDVSIASGASLTINSTLSIRGAITNNGAITATNGSIEMNGNSPQVIPAALVSGNTLKDLVINNTAGVALQGTLNLTGVLTVSNGQLIAGNYLTLKSTAAGTARVGTITSNAVTPVSGNVTVERYLPANSNGNRAWRLLTAPVSGTNINASWQEGLTWNGTNHYAFGTATPSISPANGYGTLITGEGQGTAVAANANGFDFWSGIASATSSIRRYDITNAARWVTIAGKTTENGFNSNEAYLLFIRGDRSFSTGTTANATTLRATGTLKPGTFNIPLATTFKLVGNPYASPVDFDLMYQNSGTANIKRQFFMWDPEVGSVGGYKLIKDISGTGTSYQAFPSPFDGTGGATAGNLRYIQSGQGFFVQPTSGNAATATLQIKEDDKVATNDNAAFRTGNGTIEQLRINLVIPATNPVLADGVAALYDNTYSVATTDNNDVGKVSNSTENVSMLRNGSNLLLEARPLIDNADTIFLRVYNTTVRQYQLQVKSGNMEASGLSAVLEDLYTNTTTPVNLAGDVTTISFNVTADAASTGNNRFRIVFKANQVLPVTISSVKAFQNQRDIQIEWTTQFEQGVSRYELEKSTTGRDFMKVATVNAKGNGSVAANYTWLDVNPATATNYYRIKSISLNGEIKYSGIVEVQIGKTNGHIVIYPNPVRGKTFNIVYNDLPKGKYTISLYNNIGQQLYQIVLENLDGTGVQAIRLNKVLGAGFYQLSIKGAGETIIKTVAVQ